MAVEISPEFGDLLLDQGTEGAVLGLSAAVEEREHLVAIGRLDLAPEAAHEPVADVEVDGNRAVGVADDPQHLGGALAPSLGSRLLAALGRGRTIPRVFRATALVARGYVRVGAGIDPESRSDLVWGYAPSEGKSVTERD